MIVFLFYFVREKSCYFCCCFFQAEDGIRYIGVTGVQTCALPISWILIANAWMQNPVGAEFNIDTMRMELTRSEERRVGKECRCRWSACHLKKKALSYQCPTGSRSECAARIARAIGDVRRRQASHAPASDRADSATAPPIRSGFFFSSRRRHTRYWRDWSSDVCSSDLGSSSRRAAAGRSSRCPGSAAP